MAVDPINQSEYLYAAHQKVYPREIAGRFARLRAAAVWLLLGIYYTMPWWELHGRQAVLFDLRARKFYIFGLMMWPQDFIFLTWLLVLAALSLFFFTAMAGRLWCAYACPQTVWTEAFLWMERITEGDRAARIKLDNAPWNLERLMRKGSKHLLWLVFAFLTGATFVGYFSPIRELFPHMLNWSLGTAETFWVFFYGFATWGNAGLLREQVCKYMCPYARFQSAMFDKDTLIITYDAERGEPRGSKRKGPTEAGGQRGDCIDCTWCVQVCPTGIDIREGLQIDCIACAACIDACDQVMERTQRPRGLIRYTTQHALDHQQTHVLRPRTFIYGAILLLLMAGFGVALGLRKPLSLDVLRDRNRLYRELDDGGIENVYTLKLLNKDEQSREFIVSVSGHEHYQLEPEHLRVLVAGGGVYSATVHVKRPAGESAQHSAHIAFQLARADRPALAVRREARFLGPEHESQDNDRGRDAERGGERDR
jgi:cytochrome c oxidase accessory protein FixG